MDIEQAGQRAEEHSNRKVELASLVPSLEHLLAGSVTRYFVHTLAELAPGMPATCYLPKHILDYLFTQISTSPLLFQRALRHSFVQCIVEGKSAVVFA